MDGLLGTLVSDVSSTFKSRCLSVTLKRPKQMFFKPRGVHPPRPRGSQPDREKRNVFKHFRRAWKLTENFRRAFSPGPTDCPWVSEDASRMTICVSSACSKQLPVFLIFHSEVMGRNDGKWVPIFMQLSPGSEKSGSLTPWRSGYHFYLRLKLKP